MFTWVEVNKDALQHNYRQMRAVAKNSKLMAVVKANAYGHGLTEFAHLAESFGVDWMGVSFLEEALKLRERNIKTPILVLVGAGDPAVLREAAENQIAVTIGSFQGLEAAAALPTEALGRLRVHLKIDTGMHRQGFLIQEVPRAVEYLQKKQIPKSVIEGIYTHFGAAEDPSAQKDTLAQIEQFQRAVQIIRAAGFTPLIHAATTTSALIFPTSRFDLIRVGAGLYGIWPSEASKSAFAKEIPLKPALCWKTVINDIKHIAKGSRIGYEFSATVAKDSTIAICPVGYYHGYRRSISNTGEVLIGGVRASVLGKVSMCLTAVDVSGIVGVHIGQEVTLLGQDSAGGEILLEELALWSGALNKEIISTIHPEVERRYIGVL